MRYNHLEMLPELAFRPVGKRMTLEGGGGGSRGSSTTSQQLDPKAMEFRDFGFEEAQKLYQTESPEFFGGQTFVSPSDQTQRAFMAAENRAMAGNPLLPAAQRQQQDVIEGRFLQNNPFFEQAMQGAGQSATRTFNDAIKQAQGSASMAGRFGSNVSADLQNRAASTFANTLANKAGELSFQNFANERAIQEAASGRAPALAEADFGDINKLLQVGQGMEGFQRDALQADIDRFNFEQNKPFAKLKSYMDTLSGSPSGTLSETRQSGGGKIVCTAMNNAYGFGSFRQAIWLQHSANMKNAKTIEAGYHALFLPVVAYAFNEKRNALRNAVRGVAEHIARHRTADLWKEMRGKKRDTLGRIYRAIIEPICYLVGKAKGV